MATITVPSDPTLPVAGAEIKAPPLKDWITNIRTFIESTSIDESNVDTSGTDGIVGKSISQTITGLKTFSNVAAAAGGLREVAKFEINPVSGTPAANDGLRMTFTADDAGGAATAIGYIDLKMTDASASSEDSEWRLSTIANASSVTPLVVNSTAITMTTGTVAIGTNATVGGTLVVTGGGTFGSLTVGDAAISEAELEMLDGITPGTIAASKAVVVNSNKDASDFRDVGARNIILTGELDAVTLDISGDADIDGTLEADAITLGGTALGSLYSPIAGSSSIVTTGALNSGSITSGFGTIDTGSSTITTTGVVTAGGFTIGSAVVDEAELEILDGATVTTAELNILDGVTSTAAEINLLDALDRGSIIYGNASGVTAVLGQGGAGTVLTSDGTDISWGSAGGSGDFSGPGSSSDNAIVRFDGTGGKTGQNSSVLIDDSNNITGAANVTLSGELDAATLDISGDADIDGTLEADAITLGGTALGSLYSPIAGSSSIATVGTVTAGAWQSSTVIASAYLDAQTAHLNETQSFTGAKTFGAASQFNSTITVGANDAGYDVIFYGNTASANATWDTSADDLILSGVAGLVVPDGQLTLGSTAITSTAAEINLLDALDRGSIIYGNASGATTVLGQGGAGTVLTSDGDDISWAAATGGHTIQEEGSSLTQRTKLNFIGAGVTATDDSGNDATKVTITPTGASLPFTNSNGGSDAIALTSAALGESLVSDTSPQLGGNLDVNGQSIVSDASNENIPITPHGTGSVVISKADINGGAIDGTAIGAASASTGVFTSLSVSDGNITNVGDIAVDTISGDADANTTIGFPGSDVMTFSTGGTEALQINDEGVLGIKTTPAGGWHTDHGVLQIGTGALWVDPHDESAASNMLFLSNNLYRDSADEWRHIVTDEATRYYQYGGEHYFDTAPSGSAGAAASFTNRFKIDSSGNTIIKSSSTAAFNPDSTLGNLHIVNTATDTDNQFAGIAFQVGNGSGDGQARIDAIHDGTGSAADLALSTRASDASVYERMRITSAGNVLVNDTSNASMTQGITISMGANDNEIFAVKSSDIAHGVTAIAETDTFGLIQKRGAATGGLQITGLAEDNGSGINLRAYAVGSLDTTPATTTSGPMRAMGFQASGTNVGNMPANGLVFSVGTKDNAGNAYMKFHVDEDGDISCDGSSTLGTFDTECDYQLVRSARDVMMPTDMHTHSREIVEKHGDLLEKNRIIFRNRDTDGVPFVNLKRGLFLAWDGIYQTGKKVYEDLSPAVDEMRTEIAELKQSLKLLQEAN